MRVSMLVGSLLLVSALGGCAGQEGFPQWDAQYNGTYGGDGNATIPAADGNGSVIVDVEEVEAEPAPTPPIPSVAYEAPTPIDLAVMEGDGATLSLRAGPDGLACVSTPTWDPDSAPRGYKLVETWTECSLAALNETFVEVDAPSWNVSLPVTDAIPVDNITWTMTVGRIVENNTGAREQIVVEAEERLWAAPSVDAFTEPYWPVACATFLGLGDYGMETLTFASHAHNGRALLEVDLEGYDVLDWHSDQNATFDNSTLRVEGPWAHVSEATVEVDIYFRAQDPGLLAIGGPECPTATSVEAQFIPFSALAQGIGAGWHQAMEGDVHVEVYSNGF